MPASAQELLLLRRSRAAVIQNNPRLAPDKARWLAQYYAAPTGCHAGAGEVPAVRNVSFGSKQPNLGDVVVVPHNPALQLTRKRRRFACLFAGG